MEKLTDKEINAIESVLIYNNDIMVLLEKRGVSKKDIEKLCDQARSVSRLTTALSLMVIFESQSSIYR